MYTYKKDNQVKVDWKCKNVAAYALIMKRWTMKALESKASPKMERNINVGLEHGFDIYMNHKHI